jgi:MoxR-like ATPase
MSGLLCHEIIMDLVDKLDQVADQLACLIVSKERQIHTVLTCMVAGGHLLLDDLPGMGKTTLAQGIARSLGLDYARVQFTNDLLPADVLGASVFLPDEGRFEFRKGPVFSQLLLADEINRAPPKSQSALLEAMEERQVSIDGVTRGLPEPFFVIATQNPHESSGAYALPESQADRFLASISLGYPDESAEKELIQSGSTRGQLVDLAGLLSVDELLDAQAQARTVRVSPDLADYIFKILQFSRESGRYQLGLSPRAGLAIASAAKASAWLARRDYVLPEDVQNTLTSVVSHRLVWADRREKGAAVVEPLLSDVAIP